MAQGNLPACLAETLEFEGGFTKDRRDPGNWTGGKVGVGVLKGTNMGIAAASFPDLDIANLKRTKVEEIYAARYWRPVRGDDLPRGVDLVVFDYGVNSGVGRASRHLQTIIGATADGKIGPNTLNTVAMRPARDVIKALCAKRLGFVQSLAIWNTFGRGWSRRIAHMEAKGLSFVSSKSQLDSDAKAARDTAISQGGGAVITTGGGVGIEQAPDLSGLPIWALVALVTAIAVPLLIRAIINTQRASALTQAAKGV